MIVSRNGKTYDTSDGSEHPHEASAHEASAPRREPGEREEISRWEDDGPAAGPQAAATVPGDGEASRPAWSVQSLSNLLEAIRGLSAGVASDRGDDAPRAPQRPPAKKPADAAGPPNPADTTDGAAAARAAAGATAAAAEAERLRYRNAWENT